ncbi:hypothetical protein [Paenibacillus gansuensis]|uniref:Copper amine oxidase-like N-terminal domain-containing protein n=1 Tax=Paenibacillus gansuensis TaxID=306542 RepID=A0ABW5P980_9BACL
MKFKKTRLLLMLALTTVLLLPSVLASAEIPSSPQLIHVPITIKGQRGDVSFLFMSGRLYAPSVLTLNRLLPPRKGGMSWDNKRKAVEFHLASTNGIVTRTILPAIVRDGRSYVAIRDAAAFFGYDIYWNRAGKEVTLRTLTSLDGLSRIDATADPGAVQHFLKDNRIPNGDIFLKEGKLHINVVGLTPATEAIFERSFNRGTFILHDVIYTVEQLRQAQDAFGRS